MNEQELSELLRLKQQQARLERELSSLAGQLAAFEQRLKSEENRIPEPPKPERVRLHLRPQTEASATPSAPIPPAAPIPLATNSIPPIIVAQPAAPLPIAEAAAAPSNGPEGADFLEPAWAQAARRAEQAPGAAPPVPPPIPPSRLGSKPNPAPEATSLEMRVGTYWLVRIGVVLVLTGLVFFGNLAYQNYISRLGPGGKVSLLYLASALMLAGGAWWQRKAVKQSLKNYAQVLFAGGLAAVYFTTYAAHHIPQLQVIGSPTLDGVLLLGWAAFMVFIADRKKSEVLALFAVGLAYYSSIITHVGYFTLYSNLVLTATAVFFLVRNRWATLTFGSLVATYGAYAYWRFFDGTNWHLARPEEGLWNGAIFLFCYWFLFSAAVFLSRDEKFAGQNRATFLTLNNGALFGLFLLTMLQVRTSGFWKFSLTLGAALLVLAEVARRVLAKEPLAKNSYLTQGLVLVTLGIISNPKLAGLNLALVLAGESVVLLTLGQQRKNLILSIGAYLCAALALGWGIDGMRQMDRQGLWLAIGLGVLMLANALISARRASALPGSDSIMRPAPSYFTVLALAAWFAATWDNTARENVPVVLALAGMLLTASVYVFRVPEITCFSQCYIVLAQVLCLLNVLSPGMANPAPAWRPVLLIGISLGLSHWWERQKTVRLSRESVSIWQGLYALAVVGILYYWLQPKVSVPGWLVLSSSLALAVTAYGVFTRAWLVGACAQIFTVAAVGGFTWQLATRTPPGGFALAPMAVLAVLSAGTVLWFKARPDSDERVSRPLLQLSMLYRWVALAMSIWWCCEYIPARERIWVLALVGVWVFLWAGLRRSREALLFSAAYTATALALFWLPLLEAPKVYWPNLIAIVALLAQRQTARRLPERYPVEPAVHSGVIVIGCLSVWLFVSRWVADQFGGAAYLTASWSMLALALFTAGMALRERMYRWMGLLILACALGRVVFLDVWKLEALYRILSFMALGIVLLVLGFIYSKYQEKIKEWL